MAGIGPTLPTWGLQQVVGYLRYTGRDADVVAKAALDPKPPPVDPASTFRHFSPRLG